MPTSLPQTTHEFMDWSWERIEPHFQELETRIIDQSSISAWLGDWSHLSKLIYETRQRLWVATTRNTVDQESERRYREFLDQIYPAAQASEQKLKERLLASGLEPEGFQIPLRNMRAEAAIFREENLPLLSEELKLATDYDRIIGEQTVEWGGEEVTLAQLSPVFQNIDRSERERAWRLAATRQLEDRGVINNLWGKLLSVRIRLADNAGLSNYREYRWQQMLRFDYMPSDCKQFQDSIEAVVVPVAQRLYEKRRNSLGVDTLRPWDLDVDPLGRPPLRPFESISELESKTSAMFHRVSPELGEYFEIMRRESLLDLENRKGKAPGGYCTEFPVAERPFIFCNSVGVHDDVQTLLHEGGHAFHVFESINLPYFPQLRFPLEFAEVASTGMELLAAPYLTRDQGGFYSREDANRSQVETLERGILFWPYMAVVDAFQHWVYENPSAGANPDSCDAKWAELWDRFMIGVDWSGLQEEMVTGWQRKLHIHTDPFYYVEYGLAQLGAIQVWRNALKDQTKTVEAYRNALSLGGTAPLPGLFEAAGVKFAFDPDTLADVVTLMEEKIGEMEG